MLRIASVLFSYYPADPRPRREAEALAEAGMSVDVLCLKDRRGEPGEEEVNGIHVLRLPATRTRRGKGRYLWEYAWFIFVAFVKLSILHMRKRYDVVHVHNMPDVLVFCALLPRLNGSKIILDLHDPMPEIYMTKYSVRSSHPAIRLLRLLEKWSIRFANAVVTPNLAFRNLFLSRSCPEWKMHIVMNSPQETIFKEDSNRYGSGRRNEFIVMFHGAIMERNGLDTALQALLRVRKEVPNVRFEVYGEGDFVKPFLKLVKKLNLTGIVNFHGYRPLEVIAEAIETIDVGIIPSKMSPFTNLNLPTRIFEYLSMGRPVIAPRTQGILDYFDQNSLYLFEPGNPDSLAERIIEVYQDPTRCQEILERGVKIYQAYRWKEQRKEFIGVVKNLAAMDG
jgi:glycosyltransferase involved in cell wall biosynthesis